MIESLTPEQEALIPVFRDKWLEIGLSTQPATKEDMEASIAEAYVCGGLEAPKIFLHFQSPMEGVIAAYILSRMGPDDEITEEELRAAVVAEKNNPKIKEQIGTACYGSQNAGWLSFYDYFREIGVTGLDILNGLFKVAKSVGWWWPFQNCVVVTPKPIKLNRDPQHRLHCEDGPSLLYPDGWGIWAWHGVRVNRQIIEFPETITVEMIDKETNTEVRRVLIERYGKEKYLLDGGAVLIHEDDWGKLWRKEIPNDEPLVMVELQNSTMEEDGSFKTYFQRCDPQLRPLPPGDWSEEKQTEWMSQQRPQELTALNAVASTFGERGETYCPKIQS